MGGRRPGRAVARRGARGTPCRRGRRHEDLDAERRRGEETVRPPATCLRASRDRAGAQPRRLGGSPAVARAGARRGPNRSHRCHALRDERVREARERAHDEALRHGADPAEPPRARIRASHPSARVGAGRRGHRHATARRTRERAAATRPGDEGAGSARALRNPHLGASPAQVGPVRSAGRPRHPRDVAARARSRERRGRGSSLAGPRRTGLRRASGTGLTLYRPRAMRVGVAREIKSQEYRVALTPAGARELVQRGHEVLVEAGAGLGSAFADDTYERAGASIGSVDDVWSRSELLLKVKEPIAPEYSRLRPGLTLFTYLHIAADEPLTRALVESGVTAIAYETVETPDGALPLLAPMSEIAGRLAPQAGAHYLEKPKGGRGILLGGVAGVAPARALVIGGGMVGYNAAVIAIGMGAQVTILERSVDRMRHLEQVLSGRVSLLMSSSLQIEESLKDADLVIGAVLIPGALAPKLITREMLGGMKEASVLVDDAIVHYCVANMPGAVPITSTRALTNVTLPFVEQLADHGVVGAIRRDAALA